MEQITENDWELWRDLRLTALEDAPYAFGSTLARELSYVEENWRGYFPLGSQGANFVGHLDDVASGMCAVIRPEPLGGVPLLVAMWVAPEARGTGLAEALVRAAEKWCVEHDWSRLLLHVVDGNLPAERLYRRLGYLPTGWSEPLHSDPTKNVIGFCRVLS